MVQCDRRCYVLCRSGKVGERDQVGSERLEELVLAASTWSQESQEQVWVYDQGHRSIGEELWRMGARWELGGRFHV